MNVKIPSNHSIYENVYKLHKIFLFRVFALKCIFQIKFKIPILELMLLPKNSVPFEGLYYSSCENMATCYKNQSWYYTCVDSEISSGVRGGVLTIKRSDIIFSYLTFLQFTKGV